MTNRPVREEKKAQQHWSLGAWKDKVLNEVLDKIRLSSKGAYDRDRGQLGEEDATDKLHQHYTLT